MHKISSVILAIVPRTIQNLSLCQCMIGRGNGLKSPHQFMRVENLIFNETLCFLMAIKRVSAGAFSLLIRDLVILVVTQNFTACKRQTSTESKYATWIVLPNVALNYILSAVVGGKFWCWLNWNWAELCTLFYTHKLNDCAINFCPTS